MQKISSFDRAWSWTAARLIVHGLSLLAFSKFYPIFQRPAYRRASFSSSKSKKKERERMKKTRTRRKRPLKPIPRGRVGWASSSNEGSLVFLDPSNVITRKEKRTWAGDKARERGSWFSNNKGSSRAGVARWSKRETFEKSAEKLRNGEKRWEWKVSLKDRMEYNNK